MSAYFNLYRIANEANQMKFLEQNHLFVVDCQKKICRLAWDKSFTLFRQLRLHQKKLYPSWFRFRSKLADTQLPRDPAQQVPELDAPQSETKGDIYHLVHTGANIEITNYEGMSYLKLTYKSAEEARYRAFALALTSYRFILNGTHLKLLDYNHISSYAFILPYEQVICSVYGKPPAFVSARACCPALATRACFPVLPVPRLLAANRFNSRFAPDLKLPHMQNMRQIILNKPVSHKMAMFVVRTESQSAVDKNVLNLLNQNQVARVQNSYTMFQKQLLVVAQPQPSMQVQKKVNLVKLLQSLTITVYSDIANKFTTGSSLALSQAMNENRRVIISE